MATTQNLTELPVIQYTGMDYSTVIAQIKEIIENNSNWASNWTQFYNSDAGTLLIQLMAWICDNLAIRQDLLYNESFLATASSENAKRRLLKQIGYSMRSNTQAKIELGIEFKNIVLFDIDLSNVRENERDLSEIKKNIFKFYAPNINGKSVPWEIYKLDEDGNPDYTYSVRLRGGSAYYTNDINGNKITAIQGNTVYLEFTSDTADEPVFELNDDNIDINTVKVYDITAQNKLHKRVDNFTDYDVLNGTTVCYVLEQNMDGKWQIRYPSRELVTYGAAEMEDSLFVPGNTICVLYRTCEGGDSNIAADYISTSDSVSDIIGNSHEIKITNVSSGSNGSDAETLSNAVKNAPLLLTSMNRAVTTTDYDRILKRYKNVAIAKTFTPDNMPGEFERYFGRKINPHEAFAFLALNKNFNNIPNKKLNYFPWIERNKSHILNERYIFGNAQMNKQVNWSQAYYNAYIGDDYDGYKQINYNTEANSGQYYYPKYEITKNDIVYEARKKNNCLVFIERDDFQDTILEEKNTGEHNLKIKVQSSPTDSLFIDRAYNILGTLDNLTTANNIWEVDTHASYTANNERNIIDCIKYKYMKFVFDDLITVTVDIQQEMKDLYEIFHVIKPEWGEDVKENEREYEKYYKSYYLYMYNDPATTTDDVYNSQQIEKFGGKTEEYYRHMYDYHNSPTYAQYRRGIVQIIRDEIARLVSFNNEVDYYNEALMTEMGLSELKAKLQKDDIYTPENLCQRIKEDGKFKQKINDNTFVYEYNKHYYAFQYEEETRVSSLGESVTEVKLGRLLDTRISNNIGNYGSIEIAKDGDKKKYVRDQELAPINANKTQETIEYFDKQTLAYNSIFTNGTSCYVDLGLQIANAAEKQFLRRDYLAREEQLIQYYSFDNKKDFYRININGRIFAIRLDAFSAIAAYNHYLRLSLNNDVTDNDLGLVNFEIWDYYPYIGKGAMMFGLKDSREIKEIDLKKYMYSRTDGAPFAIPYNEKVHAELELFYNSAFSKRRIAATSETISPDQIIEYDTTLDSSVMSTDKIKAVEFSLDLLALTLEYIFSPLNTDKEVIYELKNGEWFDLKTDDDDQIKRYFGGADVNSDDKMKFRNVLDGNFRVRKVKKSNYNANNIVDLERMSTNEIPSGYEYDIRFEHINGKELDISSVSEQELCIGGTNETVKLNGRIPEDLIEQIYIGHCRRKYHAETSDYVNNINDTVYTRQSQNIGVSTEDWDEYLEMFHTLVIESQKKGEQSSIYFIQTAPNYKNELVNDLGLKDGMEREYYEVLNMEYFNRFRSNKAYGKRIIELFIGDSDTDNTSYTISSGVPSDDILKIRGDAVGANTASVEIGDILCTSTDLNYKDFENVYLSYTYNNDDSLRIEKQENFYYSSDPDINNHAKPPIIGIEGQSVYKHNEDWLINKYKSNFGVKLTRYEVDTNSYYAIEENTYDELEIKRNDFTTVETMVIQGYDINSNLYKYSGAMYGIDSSMWTEEEILEAVNMQIPLIMSFDEMTDYCPQEGEDFRYANNLNFIIALNPGRTYETTGAQILTNFKNRAKIHDNTYMGENYYSLMSKYYNTDNKLVIRGVSQEDDGNVTFYYPDESAFASGANDLDILTWDPKLGAKGYLLAVKMFYKMLFGTNLTNPEFYALYPKEEMIALNSDNIVATLNEKSGEYFYCPMEKHPLKFRYRAYLDAKKTKSKYGDYFITFDGDSFTGGYRYYIRKTSVSNFPDASFCLHFINDRTYEPERNTEEDQIVRYMRSYHIIGTDLQLLQPYFKTFDLVGKVNYNANYDYSLIRYNVEEAIKKRYGLESIKDIEIGNNIYRSDIYRIVLGITGVESFELEYFGYDCQNQSVYPDQKYSINISSQSDSSRGAEFYITSVIADSDGNHGIIFSYNKTGVTIG